MSMSCWRSVAFIAWALGVPGAGLTAADAPMASDSQLAVGMQMDDQAWVDRLLVDQLEWRDGDGAPAGAWDAQARYGNDYDKLVVRTEGDWQSGLAAQGRVDLLWDRIATRWWSLQAGARYDFGEGPARGWAAVGIAGLAPYWLEVEATFYVGDAGALAARFKTQTDLLLTQRLIVQPEVELNAYSRADAARDQKAGWSDSQAGLRLRCVVQPDLAPYAGVAWIQRVGASGRVQWVAGIRLLL
jgi:copper resistance protein B